MKTIILFSLTLFASLRVNACGEAGPQPVSTLENKEYKVVAVDPSDLPNAATFSIQDHNISFTLSFKGNSNLTHEDQVEQIKSVHSSLMVSMITNTSVEFTGSGYLDYGCKGNIKSISFVK